VNKNLDELDQKSQKAESRSEKQKPLENIPQSNAPKKDSNERAGLQLGVELVVVIAVSSAIGYAIDQWLGTAPGFLAGFFVLGVFTAFYNIYRMVKKVNMQTPGAPRMPQESDEDNAS